MCYIGMHAKSLQSCPTLCDPVDCSPPGSSGRGILQTRTLERGAVSSPGGSSHPEIKHAPPAALPLQADSSLLSHRGRPHVIYATYCIFILFILLMHACMLSRFSRLCATLINRSPPDSSVHGILKPRILEWVAAPSSRGSSRARDRTCVS